MRGIALLALAVIIGVVGIVQTGPTAAPPPDFGSTDTTDGDGAAASPSVWYCPWVEAGDVADTDVVVASDPSADVSLTLLDPISNTEPTVFDFDIVGPGATAIDVGGVVRRGESPATVEVSDGPAAVATLQHADGFLAGDRCAVSVPKVWYLTGGSTKTGTYTEIRLFNPFADNAEVTVTAYSEFNLDLVADLESIDVAGRSWTTIDLEPFLPFRDELAFTVETASGLVIPALIRSDDRGVAMWPGAAPSQTWDFPIVTPGRLEPFLAVMSAGDDEVTVTVDVITENGPIVAAREIVIDGSAPALIPLSDIAAPPYGARVRASSPIAASVVATVPVPDEDDAGEPGDGQGTSQPSDETATTEFIRGLAGMVGLRESSTTWMVPLDTLLDASTIVWVMNPADTPTTATLLPLSDTDGDPAVVTIPAGSTIGIEVDVGIGISGYSVRADSPVTVAWEISGERGVALTAGIAGL
ncbi:MAG: DUF5719 family protein [Acidimicrobiia bacterium]